MRGLTARCLFFTIFSSLFTLSFVQAQTVSGPIASDTTWTLASSPVTVTATVTVPNGKMLTIEPGVVVKFNGGTALLVAGKIVANGNGGNPITFTSSSVSPAPGSWNGIEFQNSANVGSVFNYCIVQYAGGGVNASAVFYITGAYSIGITNGTFRFNSAHGVNTRASSPTISKTTFDHNGGYGVFSDLLSNFVVDSCTITNNTMGGIHVSVNASSASITNSLIDTNGIGIFIDNNAFPIITKNNIRKNSIGIQFTGLGSTQPTIKSNTISGNLTFGFLNTGTSTVTAERNYWGSDLGPYHGAMNPTGTGNPAGDFVDFQPWSIGGSNLPVKNWTVNIGVNTVWTRDSVVWVKNDITINNGITLTVRPGTIVKFAQNVRVTVNGALVANGKPDSLIVFTSQKDDSYGGDSNGDTTASGPNPGDWDMLYLNSGQNNSSVLNNCIVKFGGSSSNGNILVVSSSPTISNLYSSNSSNYGLYLSSSNSNITNSVLGGNNYRGLYLNYSNSTIANSNVSNNGDIGIWGTGTSRIVIRKSVVSKNGSTGIHVDGGTGGNATVEILDSCTVTNNNGNGIYSWAGTGPQVFSNSKINGNNGVGIWCFNMNDTVRVTSDSVQGNTGEGIVTSRAIISNNLIQGNRYPIGLLGRVNSRYSGNTITGNQYNNSIALRLNRTEETFNDTLKTTFPAGMTSGTYVLFENNTGNGVNTGQTLVIQPGVIIKMWDNLYLNVYGTVIANGTQANPIVVTSYRDASYGGKTNLASDTLKPAAGDWQYIQLLGGAGNSVFRNCVFKYAGRSGYAPLLVSGITLSAPVDSVVFRKSAYYGVYVTNSLVTFSNCTIDSNGSFGVYSTGSSPRADVTVRYSTIQDNASHGLYADGASTYREVSNCLIRRNGASGVGVSNGSIPEVFVGNTITNNNGHGIYNLSSSVATTDVQYIGNIITDNLYEGIFSTGARFVDNQIRRNRYPLGVWGRLGNIYVDQNGVDGNVFQQNQYNNAIALGGQNYAPLYDTLKNVFPQGMTSKTYVAVENIRINGTLVIQPGVTVKFQLSAPNYNDAKDFEVYGALFAVGTPGNPIVFTSWRDSISGGKTAAVNDYGAPSPGDYYYVYFGNGAGASVIRNCQFKYAGRNGYGNVYFESNLGGLVFSNNLVRKSQYYGIYVNNTILGIDSTRIDSCASYGLYVNNAASTNVSLSNSIVSANGSYGIYAAGPNGKFSTITNSTISYNNATGIYIQNNTIPLSIVGNTVSNNNGHGMYILAVNDAYDTLLTIAGNKVRNNQVTGIFSSRAMVIDDSVTGNRFAIGVVGQISLDGTTTAAGNYYQGNYLGGNTFPGVLVTEENTYGRLGLSFPAGYTSKVVAVRGDLTVPTSTTLTVAPGTVVKFPKEYGSGRITVNGVLKSEGTTNSKIVFTSWKDDSYGGDSNADTNSTVPGGGNWDMIYLSGASNNASHLRQTIVRYGGATGNGNVLIASNNCPVDSSFFSFSSNYGLYLSSSSSPVTGNEIHHNPTGILLQGTSSPVVSYNNFHDNSSYGLNNQTSNTVNAANNYWGDASGPFVNQGAPQNLAGLGNRIGINPGAVTYIPYLTARSGVLLGDVSTNGNITAFDASLVLQYLVSSITLSPAQTAAADVTGDGSVSAFDASYILRYVVGLITGFPGLGKSAVDETIATSYDLKLEQGAKSDEFQLVLHLNGTSKIYGAELGIDFDRDQLSAVGLSKTSLSESLTSFDNLREGAANIAMATADPVADQGDLIRLLFKAKHAIQGQWQSSIHVNRLVLNETNLAASSTTLEVNAQTLKGIPTTFGLAQNYPNPFNPTTTIEYQLPTPGSVSIKVYDMLGREVRELVNREQAAGFYSLNWNGTNTSGQAVASGMYVYRIQVTQGDRQTFTEIKKMMFLK
ncbi:MAG: right-handed parallel beta-helix repeat-containing protein [Bacteroidota bacterium]